MLPALLVCACNIPTEAEPAARVRLASPITHSDWMVREPAPAWGPEGVRQILDRCKECGWSRVYWRCLDGGRTLYPSRILEPLHKLDAEDYLTDHGHAAIKARLEQYDWGSFDAFAEAVEYGHKIGIEVHAWLSINEDDHGYGWTSRYTREHPESRWIARDGRVYRSQQSFAFEAVRKYKLAVLREVLAYQPDGVFFDWIRTGDVRDNPHTDAEGVANYGYEAPNVKRFREQHGLDPHEVPNDDERWVACRAEPQTLFMRRARRLIRRKAPDAVVSAMVQHPWSYRGAPDDTPYADSLRGLLCDVGTWAEEGLVDEVVAAGYYRDGGTPEQAWRWLSETVGDEVDVWLFGWIGSTEQFAADTERAEQFGAPELLLWESDYIGLPPAKDALVSAMREYAAPYR